MGLLDFLGFEDDEGSLEEKLKDAPNEKVKSPWYAKIADALGMGLQTLADGAMVLAYAGGAPVIPLTYMAVKTLGGSLTAGARVGKTINYLREGNSYIKAGSSSAINSGLDALAWYYPGGSLLKYITGDFFEPTKKSSGLEEKLQRPNLPLHMKHAAGEKSKDDGTLRKLKSLLGIEEEDVYQKESESPSRNYKHKYA